MFALRETVAFSRKVYQKRIRLDSRVDLPTTMVREEDSSCANFVGFERVFSGVDPLDQDRQAVCDLFQPGDVVPRERSIDDSSSSFIEWEESTIGQRKVKAREKVCH